MKPFEVRLVYNGKVYELITKLFERDDCRFCHLKDVITNKILFQWVGNDEISAAEAITRYYIDGANSGYMAGKNQ